jgi:hypothetical protein
MTQHVFGVLIPGSLYQLLEQSWCYVVNSSSTDAKRKGCGRRRTALSSSHCVGINTKAPQSCTCRALELFEVMVDSRS